MQCILLYNQIKTADDMCNFKSGIISSGATRGHLGKKKKNQNPIQQIESPELQN